jgi:Uma2 family endonuclease
VVSPSETSKDIRDKIEQYLASGTVFVLCVYPEDRTVDVHTLNADGSRKTVTLTTDDTFEGDSVMPGFKLMIAKVFPQDYENDHEI